MRRLTYNRLSREDLLAASDWYDKQVPGLGDDFRLAVFEGLLEVAEFPLAWPEIEGEARHYPLRRFPFSIVYRLIGNEEIRVVAVAHQHRRPRFWEARK